MKPEQTLADRLKALKVGQSIVVDKDKRNEAYEIVRSLKKLNPDSHEIKSVTCDGGFKFFVVP